ncbi:MAG: prephenate dehydratase [Solirubrobacteraceae bacterium]|nr:prephenate dehydratase [Solirubrobacteraceae bacterium]
MRLGYLGPEGTFSEDAVRSSPDAEGATLVALPTVRDTVMAVHDGSVERAVVPIENALEGPIGVTLDTLADDGTHVEVVGEVVVPVSPCLIVRDGTTLAQIERVLSHPQAISQCARFLREHLPTAAVAAADSTAEAVRIVAGEAAPWAALGTRRAASLYGASILAADVADEPGNATRFVWLAREPVEVAADVPSKTSLAFWGAGDDSPGWLVRCLSEFAFRGVNLTKIESRPLRAQLGHYRFFVDCEGHADSKPVAEAVAGLRAHCERVEVLGSYPAAV